MIFKKKSKTKKPLIYTYSPEQETKQNTSKKTMTRRDFLALAGKIALGLGATVATSKLCIKAYEGQAEKEIQNKEALLAKEIEEKKAERERQRKLQAMNLVKTEKIRQGINEQKMKEFEDRVTELREKYNSKERGAFLKEITNKTYSNNLAVLIAKALNVDPTLVLSIIKVESENQRFVQSPKNALGLMQLLRPTEKDIFDRKLQERYGKKIFSRKEFGLFMPHYNIYLGVIYLKSLYFDLKLIKYLKKKNIKDENEFEKKRLELTIKAYNAGLGNVLKNEKISADYYKSVSENLKKLKTTNQLKK